MSSEKETLIFIINVAMKNKLLLENAKIIAKHQIERKIFFRPKDEIGLILMGTNESTNKLRFDHIKEFDNIKVANWDLVKAIKNLDITNKQSNWVEAIYVALEFIKQECLDKSMKKIILLSDFEEESDIMNQFSAKEIVNALTEQNVHLLAIGKRNLDLESTETLTSSEKLLMDVYQQMNAQYFSMENVLEDTRFYKKKETTALPWSCNLEIGDIVIPIKTYIKVKVTDDLSSWNKAIGKEKDLSEQHPGIRKERIVELERKKEYQDRQRQQFEKEDITSGYEYGREFIPCTKEDEEAMVYESGPASYAVLIITSKEDVPIQYWYSNDTTRVVVPANKSAETKFYCLAQALENTDCVLIVRSVYRKNSLPRMVALFPRINVENDIWCLVEIPLPYKEDRRMVERHPLHSIIKELSKDQNTAVDKLLDAFKLPDDADHFANDETHAFLPGCVPNPNTQYVYQSLSYRALHPDEPLPPVDENLKKLISPSPVILKRAEQSLKEIKDLFHTSNWSDLSIPKAYLSKIKEKKSENGNEIEASQIEKMDNTKKMDTLMDIQPDSDESINADDLV